MQSLLSLLQNAKNIRFNSAGTLLVSKDVESAIKEIYAGGGSKPFAPELTDPALNAITTSMIDNNGGVVITLTTTGNNQTIPAPTDTTIYHIFRIINNDTSTHPITIIGAKSIVLQPGEKMVLIWDGTSWIGMKDDSLWVDDGTDYKMKYAPRNIDMQDKGFKDNFVTTAVKLGDSGNTSFDTVNKTIIGSGNELFARLEKGLIEVSNTFGIETKTLDSFLKADGKMVIYDYQLDDGTNFRHGVISASWDGTNIDFSDEYTDTIGTIAIGGIVLSTDIDSDNVRLRVVSTLAGFTLTAYRRIR